MRNQGKTRTVQDKPLNYLQKPNTRQQQENEYITEDADRKALQALAAQKKVRF